MNGDEQLLRGRVYGCDHDDPDPGPLPHQTYAVLISGPLDGLLLDITGWRPEEVDGGAALSTELGRFPGGRSRTTRAPVNLVHRARVRAAVMMIPEPGCSSDRPGEPRGMCRGRVRAP
ncbi:hypothetical protein GCM10022420_013370 [Streptomyces iranensis]|uniref:Uncharacterized protein n=1 Tax=Streptomyces iranensis TaxID=576784 RepID=A0A061A7L2_9ACTN|nr:hypothetical protein [Streptomyces iranensis]CDR13008.1 predicted protein [Streptomyces iranensis]